MTKTKTEKSNDNKKEEESIKKEGSKTGTDKKDGEKDKHSDGGCCGVCGG